MEERDKESTSLNGSICVLTFESSNVSPQRKESTLIVDKRRLGSCKSIQRIESFSCRSQCSKLCTENRKRTVSNGPQTSDCEPQMLHESSSCQRKSETKPAREMPLSDQLKTKMKKMSRKLQSSLSFFKKTTRLTVTKMRSLYHGFRRKRALGFKCDLRKCESTLIECSSKACRKKSMIFGESSRPCYSKTSDFSISNTSTSSEDRL